MNNFNVNQYCEIHPKKQGGQMTGKFGSPKLSIVLIAVIFILNACNSRDSLMHFDGEADDKPYSANISDQDVSKFVSSVRKVDGAIEAKYRMARHFQKKNRHKVALAELRDIIHKDPTFVKAYNAMGFSYEYLGDLKKAIRSYKFALKIDPNLGYVHNNLGFAYLLSDNYDSAIDAFQKAIALNNENKRFHNNLGLAYAKSGQFDLALEQFRVTGDEFSAYYRLGQILYREGNYDMAFQYSEKAYHARASAQIMSSMPDSEKTKNTDAVIRPTKVDSEFTSSARSSAPAGAALKSDAENRGDEKSALSADSKQYQMPADERSGLKPVIIRKSIHEVPGFADPHDQRTAHARQPDLPDKESAIEGRNPGNLSEDEPARATPSEDVIKGSKDEKRPEKNTIVEVEIEVSNGNGVDGMAQRLGRYLKDRGFKVTRLENANSFSHEKTKIFYYNGHLQEVQQLLQKMPGHLDIESAIELKRSGNRIKILIGKDIIPYDKIISKAYSKKHPS